jgi:hypothetical protein
MEHSGVGEVVCRTRREGVEPLAEVVPERLKGRLAAVRGTCSIGFRPGG